MASKQHSTREREREVKLLPQTHSPEVDYSIFIMVAVLVMLERVEMQLGMARQRSPSNLHRFSLCFAVFVFLRCLLSRMPRGSIYSSFEVKPVSMRSKQMAADARGGNKTWWRGLGWATCHLCSFGPHGPPSVLLIIILFLRGKY
jgi:hypothetical protein